MKYLYLILAMFIVACDDTGTRSDPPAAPTGTLLRDTTVTHKIIMKTITTSVKDTIRQTNDTAVILGTMTNSGAAGSVVICSETMNKCSRPNKSGVYLIQPSVRPLVAGRLADVTDTVATPDSIKANFKSDTLVGTVTKSGVDTATDSLKSDSLQVEGTDSLIVTNITIIDTVYEYDTTATTVTIVEPTPVPVKDTLSVVVDGTVMREVPIDSWGHILPVGYVDKWNVEVYDTITTLHADTVQFVYFATGDSIAQVVNLGRETVGGVFTNRFSGSFFYFWNDSAYKKDLFIHNYFIRAKDSTGAIVSKTDVAKFSAKAFPATVTYLKHNVAMPQHMILPKFVPAAKNNKKLGESVSAMAMSEDTTKNWIDQNQLPYTSYIYRPKADSVGTGVVFNSFEAIDFAALGIKRVSFKIETEADSVYLGASVSAVGVQTIKKATESGTMYVDLTNKAQLCIIGWKKTYAAATVTEVRFHFN